MNKNICNNENPLTIPGSVGDSQELNTLLPKQEDNTIQSSSDVASEGRAHGLKTMPTDNTVDEPSAKDDIPEIKENADFPFENDDPKTKYMDVACDECISHKEAKKRWYNGTSTIITVHDYLQDSANSNKQIKASVDIDIFDRKQVLRLLDTVQPPETLKKNFIRLFEKAVQSYDNLNVASARLIMLQKMPGDNKETIRRINQEMELFSKHIEQYYSVVDDLEVYRVECTMKTNAEYLVNKNDGVYDLPPNTKISLKPKLPKNNVSQYKPTNTTKSPMPLRSKITVVKQNSVKLPKYDSKDLKRHEHRLYVEDDSESDSTDDGDDSFEEDPVEVVEWVPGEITQFRYEIAEGWWIFKARVEKWGVLPFELMSILRQHTTGINALNRNGYTNAVYNNEVVKRYLDYYQKRSNVEYEMFCYNLDAFYYHSASYKMQNGTSLSLAGSWRAEQQRTMSRNLNNYTPLSGIKLSYVLKAMLASGVLIYMLYKRWMRNKGRVGPHQVIPCFPTFSMYLEEAIKTIPGGYWLIAIIERFIYGDWHTLAFHRESSKFTFSERIKLHRWVNGISRASNTWKSAFKRLTQPAVMFNTMVSSTKKHFSRVVNAVKRRFTSEPRTISLTLPFGLGQEDTKWTLVKNWIYKQIAKLIPTFTITQKLAITSWILLAVTANKYVEHIFCAAFGLSCDYTLEGIAVSIFGGFALAFCAYFVHGMVSYWTKNTTQWTGQDGTKYYVPGKNWDGVEPPGYKRAHQLIPGSGRLGIIAEEIVKCIPGGWCIIAFLERLTHGDWKTYKWHKRSAQWNLSTRITEHMKKNGMTRHGDGILYLAYKMHVSKAVQHKFPEVVEPMLATKMPKFNLPKIQDAKPKPYATYDHPETATPSPETHWHALFWCVNKMASPANTFENAAACIDERVRKLENRKINTNLPVYKSYTELAMSTKVDKIKIPNWEQRLKPIQRENLKVARKMREENKVVNTIKTQLKCDEHIWFDEKGVARFLVNGSKTEFLDLGKTTAEISTFVSDFMWGPNCTQPIIRWKNGKQYVFVVYFTCGATSDQLSAFVNAISGTQLIGIKALGDDSHLQEGKEPKQKIVENDFRTYDRTQSKTLRQVINDMLEKNGFAKLVRGRERMYRRTLKMFVPNNLMNTGREKHLAIVDSKGKKADMRYSGEAATCLDNTFVNAFTTMAVWMEVDGKHDLLASEYEKLGLIAKIQIVDLQRSTYLKGTYIAKYQSQEVAWIRLPSFLLKFGKTQEDPEVILKQKHLTLNEKCRLLLRAQWLGYGDMRSNWFYGALDDMFRNVTTVLDPVNTDFSMQFWQITQRAEKLDDDAWNAFMLARYKITVEEMLHFLETLKHALTFDLPVLYHHPMIMKFSCDY